MNKQDRVKLWDLFAVIDRDGDPEFASSSEQDCLQHIDGAHRTGHPDAGDWYVAKYSLRDARDEDRATPV